MLTSSKAELKNKVIISVGNQIITDYDLTREKKYLNIITTGRFKNMDKKELRKIAIDSLIKEKIKVDTLERYDNITIKNETINNHIVQSALKIGFQNLEDFKKYLLFEEYELDEFKKKILIEFRWNQLVYQFYKNQIIIDKEKIDKQLKTLIAKQKKMEEFLVYEIFIENTAIKKPNKESEEIVTDYNTVVEEQGGIIIKAEIASYNKKKILDTDKTNEEIVQVKTSSKITIEDLIKNIKEEGFENTANKFSSSSTAEQGGRLGWVSESNFSKLLLNSVKKTKVGSITEPISISEGVIILKVENKRVQENKIDLNREMEKLIEFEKNIQLTNFSTNYFNQVKNSIKVKYFND